MLLIASALTIFVSLMHSILGGRRLIEPILAMNGLPVILGDIAHTKLTLRAGWHLLSLMWWGIAAMLAYLHFSTDAAGEVFLWIVSILFGVSGAIALIFSRGAHLSWIFFLPVAMIAGYTASTI